MSMLNTLFVEIGRSVHVQKNVRKIDAQLMPLEFFAVCVKHSTREHGHKLIFNWAAGAVDRVVHIDLCLYLPNGS